MSLTPGQQISGYRVIGTLGRGGMGEVFRARDSRLDRDVAIKVLPEGWDDDQDHAQRFVREAKTLASLNHPNISQVYGFEEMDGKRLLILELVEGEELAERIARGPLPLNDAREICRHIADGLEAAHERGVIHRDLKPANVRITPQGAVKVLDFGLAKSTRQSPASKPPTGETYRTEPGVLVGTPTYMSPERVRGKPDDRRGDIWAFGCVLYECLTGHPPFEGETLPDTLAIIVDREPDLSELHQSIPPAIRELILRCLDKDPRTRLRDIGEARVLLERREEAASASPPGPMIAPSGPDRLRFGLLVGAAAFVAGALVMVALGERPTALPHDTSTPAATVESPPPRVDPLGNITMLKLTDDEWTEFDATLSRDGQFVAFASDRDGPFDVWVREVDDTENVNVTRGRKQFWGGRVRDIGFLPDAVRLWTTGFEVGEQLMPQSMNRRGDDVRAYFRRQVVNTDFHPTRDLVAYHTSEPGDPLFLAPTSDEETSRKLIVEHGVGLHQHYPTWSLDGDWIYVVRGLPATREMDLWRVEPVPGGRQEQLTFGLVEVSDPTPIDDDTVLFLANEPNGAGPWMWALDVGSGRPPYRVLRGVAQYTSLSGTADGRRLVTTASTIRASVWRVAIPSAGNEATDADVESVPGTSYVSARGPRVSGDDIYFTSPRWDGDGLWRVRDGKPSEVLSGNDAALVAAPAISSDGVWLAAVLRRDGQVVLERMRVDGGDRRVLSGSLRVYGSPAWSPEGDRIVIGGVDESGVEGLYVFPRDGGPPERLVEEFAINPVWSPRGDRILFAGPSIQAYQPLKSVDPQSRDISVVGDVRLWSSGERHRFRPNGREVVFLRGNGLVHDFWLIDLETGEERRLTRMDTHHEHLSFDITPDGNHIVFDRIEQTSDVVLIDRLGR